MAAMNAGSATRRSATAAGCLLAAVLAVWGAEQPSKPGDPNAPADPNGRAVRTFTNKDLGKYRSSKPADVVVGTTPAAPAGEEAAAPEELFPDEKERRIADLRKEIEAGRGRLDAIDQRLKSVSNPFLPRPSVSEEEKEAEAGLDSKAIRERLLAERSEVERKIAALEADLEKTVMMPVKPRKLPAAASAPGPPPSQP